MPLKMLCIALALVSTTLYAQTVEVKDAWVRASVQGQMATGDRKSTRLNSSHG